MEADGTFNVGVDLTAGRWAVTVTASSAQNKTTTLTRMVTVQFRGVNLVVTVGARPVLLKVWVDGKLDSTTGQGKVFAAGRTLTFTADSSIEIRTADSGATSYALNGTPLGSLGKDGKLTHMSPPDFIDYRDGTRSFAAVAVIQDGLASGKLRSCKLGIRSHSKAV